MSMGNTIGAGIGGAVGGPIGALAGWGLSKLFTSNPGDPTSFTSGGGQYKQGDLAPEGIDKTQDSLTQSTRALSNYTGAQGKSAYEHGQQTLHQSEDELSPIKDYFNKLLNGDSAEVASAMQPEADQISKQFGQIRQMFSQSGSRGGGTTSTLAASPFEQTRQLSELTARARQNAADKSGALSLNEAGLGLSEEGMGSNLLNATQQAYMARRGQNYQVDTANRQMATSGMSKVFETLV